MKLNVREFALAVGVVVAAAFSVCAFFVAVAPETTAAFLGYLLHIKLTGLTQAITWQSFFAGVLFVGVWAALWAAVAAELYNLFLPR